MLQSLQDMARALPARFGPHAQQFPEGELDDLLLKPRIAAQPLDPTGEHAALLAALPEPLLQLMQDWLLDDFSIANLQFGHGDEHLSQLLRQNSRDAWGQAWWGAGERPPHCWLIAAGDPCALVLNGATGAVHALADESSRVDDSTWVCAHLPVFLCGVATIHLGMDAAERVMRAVNGGQAAFWHAIPVLPEAG